MNRRKQNPENSGFAGRLSSFRKEILMASFFRFILSEYIRKKLKKEISLKKSLSKKRLFIKMCSGFLKMRMQSLTRGCLLPTNGLTNLPLRIKRLSVLSMRSIILNVSMSSAYCRLKYSVPFMNAFWERLSALRAKQRTGTA